MSQSQLLSGKTAVVTGASSGIGQAIAAQLGAAGAHVTLGGRTRAAMEETARAIEKAGGAARVVALDVRDVAQLRALGDGAVAETARLDILVNNAGVSFPGKIADADPEEWRPLGFRSQAGVAKCHSRTKIPLSSSPVHSSPIKAERSSSPSGKTEPWASGMT